jgi:hypothetical protein
MSMIAGGEDGNSAEGQCAASKPFHDSHRFPTLDILFAQKPNWRQEAIEQVESQTTRLFNGCQHGTRLLNGQDYCSEAADDDALPCNFWTGTDHYFHGAPLRRSIK